MAQEREVIITTEESLEGYRAAFKIDNQTFALYDTDSMDSARWVAGCLKDAFDKIGVTSKIQ